MIHLDFVERYRTSADQRPGLHALRRPRLRQVCPADAIKKDEFGVVHSANTAALHRLLELRARLPVWRAEDKAEPSSS